MPNGKPNPNCGECKGTGQIPLFTSSCICDCVNRSKLTFDFKKFYFEKIDFNYKPYDFYNDDRILKWNQ